MFNRFLASLDKLFGSGISPIEATSFGSLIGMSIHRLLQKPTLVTGLCGKELGGDIALKYIWGDTGIFASNDGERFPWHTGGVGLSVTENQFTFFLGPKVVIP